MLKNTTLLFLLFLLFTFPALADEGGHNNPYTNEFLAVFFILLAAIVGRFVARKFKQSEVLGELVIGIVIGAIAYQLGNEVVVTIRHTDEINLVLDEMENSHIGWDKAVKAKLNEMDISQKLESRLDDLMTSGHFKDVFLYANYTLLFSSLGVILLLFMVGLEVSVEEMISMGGTSFSVAFLGVLFPFLLGYLGMHFFVPEGNNDHVAIFVGATLAATSIGITARVFKDAKMLHLKEAKLVLGAAVIDDILGLVLLAVVSGIVSVGELQLVSLFLIIGKALVFLVGVFLAEKYLIRRSIKWFSIIAGKGTYMLYPFGLLLVLSWLADFIGLANIVGAFAAGLILKNNMFDGFKKQGQSLEELLAPLEKVFAPIFFVLMGFQVDVLTFADPQVLAIGIGLTIVAIAGKIAAGFFAKKGYNKLLVGIGLVPRGEVGLIFASIGKSLGVLNNQFFSVIIIVVILTTLLTPPMINWQLKKMKKRNKQSHPNDPTNLAV